MRRPDPLDGRNADKAERNADRLRSAFVRVSSRIERRLALRERWVWISAAVIIMAGVAIGLCWPLMVRTG